MDVRGPHHNDHRNESVSSRDVVGTVELLRQAQRSSARSKAIVAFCKGLRRGPKFQPFWDAVGGAAGLANLMAEFSLRDVGTICRYLGRTASAQNARPERQAGLAELVRLLYEDGPVQRDPRPLRQYYRDIVPACDLDLVQEWDNGGRAEWTKFQRLFLFGSHREWYQKRFLKDLSSPADGGAAQPTIFSAESRLFQGDLAFSETILSTLIADKEAEFHIPCDFMSAFAMPLLRRLVRRRKYDDETRDKFLDLVVRCIQVHEQELESHPVTDREELVRYTIQRWSVARVKGIRTVTTATKQQTELCLGRLIELMSRRKKLGSLRDIFDKLLLSRKTHVDSYQLLRLILQHARGYELDIDDDTSPALSRLRDSAAEGDLWPMKLFLYLDVDDAIGLFERLSTADVTGCFLVPEYSSHSSPRTVLEQNRHQDTSDGDAEIVRYLLLSKSRKRGADDPAWLARARTLIHERRKKAQDGREWQQREFWAISALNLCVAAGDMEMLDDTILWARRFNNQPMVARSLYGPATFGTVEIRDLLSAVPGEDKDREDATSDRAATVAKAIEASGRILVHLMETVKMCLAQPSTDTEEWKTLMLLPKLVVDCRLEKKNAAYFEALFVSSELGAGYFGSGAVEMVWKPTIDTLVMAEGLLSSSPNLSVEATGTYVFKNLPGRSGKIRADLTSFLFERMKMHLGPEGLRLQKHKVIDLVTGVAESDQPWLAIPFIRDLVLDGEGADSVWHRKLLSASFLSSLPYKAASELLCTMADAMRERMREQNARPREEEMRGYDDEDDDEEKAVSSPPAIKVTTIKMMAQLLKDSQIIGASAACDILLGLLAEARHIDTLAALVSSLLSFLKGGTYPPEIHTRILDALEERLTPVLPRLAERRPLSDADWAAVESGEAELPDVADETPLVWLLSDQDYDSEVMSLEARTRLIKLLVRVPSQSAPDNARWNKLFLARNGFSLDDGERLPASPAGLYVCVDFLSRFPAYFPASMFTALRDLALLNLAPTPGIARVTEAVKADGDLVYSNAGQHWLDQFDNPGSEALERFGLVAAASLLQRAAGDLSASKRDDGGGVTVQMVAESVLAVADRIIACQLPEAFEELVTGLCSERLGSRANWLAWREHCVPVLRTLDAKVDGLRMRLPGAEGEPAPRVLPSSFQLRLSMLPVPYSKPPKEPAPGEEVDDFVVELAGLVGWLARRAVPYHDEFAQLKREVRGQLNRWDYGRVAVRLGALGLGDGTAVVVEEVEGGNREPTLAGYLRLELAGHLLEAGDSMDEGCGGVLPEVKEMVRGWVGSDDELVRLAGVAVEEKHKAVLS